MARPIVYAVFFALLATLLAVHASDPWRYQHDDNGRRSSSYARSHLFPNGARYHA